MNWEARLALLRKRLQAIQDLPSEADPDLERLVKAWYKLVDLIDFADVPETQDLLAELAYLSLALIDLTEGRKVKWLEPRYAPQQARISVVAANLRARYAAVVEYLMIAGGQTKEEAAKFVGKQGTIRRLMGQRRSAPAADWKIVIDWHEKYNKDGAFARQYDKMMATDAAGAEAVACVTLQELNALPG